VRLGATNSNAVDLWLDDIGLDNAAMPLPTPPTGVRVQRYSYDGLQRLIGAIESSGTTKPALNVFVSTGFRAALLPPKRRVPSQATTG
jgi:hypothetical protein